MRLAVRRVAFAAVRGRRGLATEGSTLRSHYGLWIDGKEVEAASGQRLEVENPATGEILTTVANGDAADVERAVRAARVAFEDGRWSRMDAHARATVLQRAAGLLAARVSAIAWQETLQTGRAIREMRAQLGRLPEWLEYFAAMARTQEGSVPPFPGAFLNYVQRVPLGVCGLITPWNHPMLIAIKKIAPALATGNSVVVKPSELAPCTVLDFARLLQEAGLPDGVFNVVAGLGAAAGKALAEHPDLDKLDLTGGTETGRLAAAAAGRNLTGVVMELGGKAPVIVFPDADVDQAVNGAAFAAFVASGQTCVAGTRALVHESIYPEFVAKFAAKAASIVPGNPLDPACAMGPLASRGQRDRVEKFVALGRAEGARVVAGGARPAQPPHAAGYYYLPTVLADCQPSMRVVREEVFGPVVAALSFRDEAHAVQLANDSPFGLAASVWTKDLARAHRVAQSLDVGLVWLNSHHRNSPSSPWGGMKDSGLGRENGVDAWREYTQSKSVVVSMADEPFDWFNPPASGKPVRYG